MKSCEMNLPRFSPWLGSAQRTLLSGRVWLDIHWNFQPAGIIRIISMITMWVIEWRRSPVDPPSILLFIQSPKFSFLFHSISFHLIIILIFFFFWWVNAIKLNETQPIELGYLWLTTWIAGVMACSIDLGLRWTKSGDELVLNWWFDFDYLFFFCIKTSTDPKMS